MLIWKQEIRAEYRAMCEHCIAGWQAHPDRGEALGLPDGYRSLGVSIGSFFAATPPLTTLLERLGNLAESDDALTTVPRATLHFTFLALTGHRWTSLEQLATDEVGDLARMCARETDPLRWSLRELRLVPGKNFLLLAGIPDAAAFAARARLADEILTSPWRRHVEERYEQRGFPFPPKIWHTTLARAHDEFFAPPIRALYAELGTPTLKAVDYDWTVAHPLPATTVSTTGVPATAKTFFMPGRPPRPGMDSPRVP